MNLIFCMAGLYRRFLDAGYTTQKYLLPWGDDVILGRVLAPLVNGCRGKVVLVANQRDIRARDRIIATMARFDIPTRNLCFVPDTKGQAHTAVLGCKHLETIGGLEDHRVLLHNVDTVVEGRDLRVVDEILARDDGWIDTFPASSPAYSYVSVDGDGVVQAIAEKKVISAHATTGLYGFASIDLLHRYFQQTQQNGSELYVSDLYRTMLQDGRRLRAGFQTAAMRTIILGTPLEYVAAVAAP
jgi:hypothetical protein